MVNWKDMDAQILDAIRSLEAKGFKEPTVRAVYYVLGSLNVLPLTDQGYKSLDAKTVRMRKDGQIEWGFFAVKRGTSDEAGVPVRLPGGYRATVPYVTPEDWSAHWLEQCRKAHESFVLPRWYAQDALVEVWVEKDGLLGATANWIRDLEVTVRSPQGYGAWEFLHDSMKRIKREIEAQGKENVHIIYLGDLDPSGKDIPRFMREEAIAHFTDLLGMEDIDFIDLALTPQQVSDHNLPSVPDAPEVLAKIFRDPRRRWYVEEYGEIFTELDAFYALATDAATGLIRETVEAFFDQDIFEETRKVEKKYRRRVKAAVDRAVRWK